MNNIRQWYYRGSLTSCNYSCSYCPFSKRSNSQKQLEQDKEQLFRFARRMEEIAEKQQCSGAVQIVPYGEALLHPYYWEGMAKLSRNPRITAVGAQSNFSFSVGKMLSHYEQWGGDRKKLRLWGTFHPEMTTVEAFISQCESLSKEGVDYCVGAVAVPGQLPILRELKKGLPASVYFWVNRMDGLKRGYTRQEQEEFLELDPWFFLELKHHKADVSRCRDSVFVEGNGELYGCNLCRRSMGNLYCREWEEIAAEEKICTRKECSCYLSYCNQKETGLLFFEPYPAFRIPRYPRAVFLDVDGTLVPKGQRQISKGTKQWVTRLAKHSAIYLVTSRPYKEALKKVQGIGEKIAGGVFANGGHCLVKKAGYEFIAPMEEELVFRARRLKEKYGYRIHTYREKGKLCKITLEFPGQKCRSIEQWNPLVKQLREEINVSKDGTVLVEDNCFQIMAAKTTKREGVVRLCEKMGYAREEVLVAGNSDNDIELLSSFPLSVAVKGSSAGAAEAAARRV